MDALYEHYSSMTDEEILQLAINEVKDLREEAIDPLLKVLEKRNIDESTRKNVLKQLKPFSNDELIDLSNQFSKTICYPNP